MSHTPHDDCSPESVAARRLLVLQNHPIHARRDADPAPTMIPPGEAAALLMEAKEQYEARIREIDVELAILRDMV